MNDKNTTAPGRHLGELPDDRELVDQIQQANARGSDTCLLRDYEAMIAAGIEPDAWRLAA